MTLPTCCCHWSCCHAMPNVAAIMHEIPFWLQGRGRTSYAPVWKLSIERVTSLSLCSLWYWRENCLLWHRSRRQTRMTVRTATIMTAITAATVATTIMMTVESSDTGSVLVVCGWTVVTPTSVVTKTRHQQKMFSNVQWLHRNAGLLEIAYVIVTREKYVCGSR